MPTTFTFYADANLSSVVSHVTVTFPDTGATPVPRVVWLGSRSQNRRLSPPENSATIRVSLTGAAASHVRLGASALAAAAAIPGEALELTPPIRAPHPIWLYLDATGIGIGSASAALQLSALEEERQ